MTDFAWMRLWFARNGGRHSRRARRELRRTNRRRRRGLAGDWRWRRLCVLSRAERAAARRLQWAARRWPRIRDQVLRTPQAVQLLLAHPDATADVLDLDLFWDAAEEHVRRCQVVPPLGRLAGYRLTVRLLRRKWWALQVHPQPEFVAMAVIGEEPEF